MDVATAVDLGEPYPELVSRTLSVLDEIVGEDEEERQRQLKIEGIITTVRESSASRFTESDLQGIADGVVKLTEYCVVALRGDLVIAGFNPKADFKAAADEIAQRTDALRMLVALRPAALRRAPRLAQWWTDAVNRRTLVVVAHSERIADAVRIGNVRRLSEDEAQREMVRIIPVAFWSTRLTSDDVVDFCMRNGIALQVCQAAQLAKFAFPKASGLRLELDGDPEGTEEWVWLKINVPDDRPLERFQLYLDGVQRQIPADRANKFELTYSVA